MKYKFLLMYLMLPIMVAGQPGQRRFFIKGKHLYGYIDNNNALNIYLNKNDSLVYKGSLEDTEAMRSLQDSAAYGSPWRMADVNFDGYEDVLYNSISGNVQRFEKVLLYRPRGKSLVQNSTLSELPCIRVNTAKKTVASLCNHSSAAENWTETYVWKNGGLVKIEQEGTMPMRNDRLRVIQYKKVRKNGKWVYVYKRDIE